MYVYQYKFLLQFVYALKSHMKIIFIIMYTQGTKREEEISKAIGVPLIASKDKDLYHGTKAGSRSCFKSCGIPHPDGTYEAIKDVNVLVDNIFEVIKRNPHAKKGLLKVRYDVLSRLVYNIINMHSSIYLLYEKVK
jgi:hypothetical protein